MKSQSAKNSLSGKNVRVREGQWHYRFNWEGREHSGPTGLEGIKRNQKAAERFASDEKKRLAGEEKKRSLTFAQAAGEFLLWCADVEYRSKPNTAARIKTSFASLVEFFGLSGVGTIGAAEVEAYKAHRLGNHGVRQITLRHDLHALAVFFKKYAMKQGLSKSNPVEAVTIPSDRDAVREHVITPAEEEKYFRAAEMLFLHYRDKGGHPKVQPNLSDLARLILEQGARPEELLAARVEHLDLNVKTLLIAGGKTRASRRTLNLTESSLEILERRAKLGSIWLFPSERNPGHHLTKLINTHDRVCIEAGVSFVLYDFRHTFATRHIQSGTPVAVVAAIMGHSGLRTIHRYVHPTSEAQKAAMEKFDSARTRKLKVVG
jgi:integrase